MLRKALVVIANYSDGRQQFFKDHFSPLMARFAHLHGYEFIISNGGPVFRGNPTWWKFTIVRDYMRDFDQILHLDADMRIDKFDLDYPCNKSFTVTIDNGNTFCMGSYNLRVNDWSRRLVDNILDDNLYDRMKNDHHWTNFREQAAFYTLCGIPSHSWTPFLDLPNNGFHNNKTEETIYGIDELNEHVELLSPEWNTTLLDEEADHIGEGLMRYNIVKTKKSDTRIRHFAGGQSWRL
jgi:hypothetical protein